MSDPPHLGGFAAIALFVVILVASIAQSLLTQHVQVSLGFRQPLLLLYIVHSSFLIILPLHLLYLKYTTHQSAASHIKRAIVALQHRLTPASAQSGAFPTKRFIVLLLCLTVGITMPTMLWYIAVSLASISDVTAISNTNAFWTYLMNVRLHNAKVQVLKLSAVLLACVGVLFVVYESQSVSSDPALSSSSTRTSPKAMSGGSAPLIGNLLTLAASIGYAAYQVLYKHFVALPSGPGESISAPVPPLSPLSSTRAEYEPLVTDDDESISSSHSLRTHSSAVSDGSTLAFGLYPNLLTSAIGVATFITLWPFLVVLHWTGAEKFTLPADGRTWASVAGITLGGVAFNSAYMILLGIWGPVLASVGSLLTMVLMFLIDVFLMGGVLPTVWSILGCGMIAGGFGMLIWDVVGLSTVQEDERTS